MGIERNFVDASSCNVEELGPTEDGSSDKAIARITGTYPESQNTYVRNDECDMLVYPMSGMGNIILRTRDMSRQFRLDLNGDSEPIEVPKGTAYCYSTDEGETLEVGLTCTPPWTPEQYQECTYDDV